MYYDIFTSQTKPNFNHTPLIFNVQISLSIKFNLPRTYKQKFEIYILYTFPLKYFPTKYFLVSLKCILIVIPSISSFNIPLNLSIKIKNVKHWKTEKNIPQVIILFVLSEKDDNKNNKGIQLKTFLTNVHSIASCLWVMIFFLFLQILWILNHIIEHEYWIIHVNSLDQIKNVCEIFEKYAS